MSEDKLHTLRVEVATKMVESFDFVRAYEPKDDEMNAYFKESNKFIEMTNKIAEQTLATVHFTPPDKREVIIKVIPKFLEIDNERRQIRKIYKEGGNRLAKYLQVYLKLSEKAKRGNSEKHLTALKEHLQKFPAIRELLFENYEAFKKFKPKYDAVKQEMSALLPN